MSRRNNSVKNHQEMLKLVNEKDQDIFKNLGLSLHKLLVNDTEINNYSEEETCRPHLNKSIKTNITLFHISCTKNDTTSLL